MEMNAIQSSLYSLIQRFVQRQSLVLEALRDLRPDFFMLGKDEATSKERVRVRLEYMRRPAVGNWGENNEWDYFLHGSGCRLTHTITHERLEWDIGSLRRFDGSWFANWLSWLIGQEIEDADVSVFRKWHESQKPLKPENKPAYILFEEAVFPILEQLHEMGLLRRHHQNYTLLGKSSNSTS